MLTEPHTDTADAGMRGEGASARIDPAPRGRPVGSAAKHIVQMHHEVVLQKLGVALLLKTALVELLAIGRAPLRREGNLLRWFAIERDGSRRRIKDTCRSPRRAPARRPARSAPPRSRTNDQGRGTARRGARPGPHPRRAGRHTRPPPGGPRGRLGGGFSRAESRP